MIIFLGGTCGEDKWRETLIPMLEAEGIQHYNPVVKDWTPDCIKNENIVKSHPDCYELYVITSKMTGVYSIAEVINASNKKSKRTFFMVIRDGFDEAQLRSLDAVAKLVKDNGAYVVSTFENIISVLKSIPQIRSF